MLKKILIGVVVVLAVFAGVVATRPASFAVERSATIPTPPDTAFTQVNDFHAWAGWSPWEKLDPGMKKTFTGAATGAGSIYYWNGNDKVGEGRMTIVESRPAELVDIKVDFTRPFEGTNSSTFTLKPAGDGTAVTWSMGGHQNFFAKAMCLVMNGKKMIGDQLEDGLGKLKAVSEQNTAANPQPN